MICPYCLKEIEPFTPKDLPNGAMAHFCPTPGCSANASSVPGEIQKTANFFILANLGDGLVSDEKGMRTANGGVPTWHVNVYRKADRKLRGILHVGEDGKTVTWTGN